MKRLLKAPISKALRLLTERTIGLDKNIDRIAAIDQCTQILLGLKYRELRDRGGPMPAFGDAEFRCFSQNGEDGILLYLFSLLGHGSKRVVEVCAGNGIECNAANLIVNHGWTGLLIDGDAKQIEEGRKFYARGKTTYAYPPKLVSAWITPANIGPLIAEHGFEGEIDLLSLDMDGIDYWVWKAIDRVSPRAVVLEYNSPLGYDRALTIPDRDDFRPSVELHRGASLPAFVALGRSKGYRLVGAQAYGFNAFFLRDDVGVDLFPEVPASRCFDHPHARQCMAGGAELARLEWIEV